MPYLIDGHNLIGKLPDISLDDPNDEAKLVQKLMGFCARERTAVTVVFDKGQTAGRSRMSTSYVEVVFASSRSNADNLMIERIRNEKNPKMMTVVSSDNDVLSAARRRQMQTLKSAEFAAILKRPLPPPKPGPDEAHDVYLTPKEIEEWLRIFGYSPMTGDDTDTPQAAQLKQPPANSKKAKKAAKPKKSPKSKKLKR